MNIDIDIELKYDTKNDIIVYGIIDNGYKDGWKIEFLHETRKELAKQIKDRVQEDIHDILKSEDQEKAYDEKLDEYLDFLHSIEDSFIIVRPFENAINEKEYKKAVREVLNAYFMIYAKELCNKYINHKMLHLVGL